MTSGEPSIYYGKPDSDEGQRVSSFPIGISGLPTEPYDFSLGDYKGISEGKMGWFKSIAMLLAVVAFLAFLVYVYSWYSKARQAGAIAGMAANAAGIRT